MSNCHINNHDSYKSTDKIIENLFIMICNNLKEFPLFFSKYNLYFSIINNNLKNIRRSIIKKCKYKSI